MCKARCLNNIWINVQNRGPTQLLIVSTKFLGYAATDLRDLKGMRKPIVKNVPFV
jgi:hypothetical protein